ncbi:MAG TPA: sugar phosphate isomerase/epimerase [Tepidisphaeraceae bacterium]|jgi:sugar phosphate isomerase/epimerase
MNLLDIRIGTMANIAKAPNYIPQIKQHGFESYQLFGGFGTGLVDFPETARQVRDTLGDSAVISSIGYFGNPLMKEEDATNIAAYIDAVPLFGCDIFIGFAGAIDGKAMPESMPAYTKVWSELAKRAADKGVKIAFENCEMGGNWNNAGKWNIAHAPTMWDRMFDAIPSENIGLCWEPCHQLYSLVDPIPNLKKYIKKVFTLHGKDATVAWDVIKEKGIRGGEPYAWMRTPGFGDTNWTDVITVLRMHKWTGSIDIEGWHDPVYRGELEMTGQVQALKYLQHARGGATFVPNPKD